jgi:beta-N-acetylglucosaminidase
MDSIADLRKIDMEDIALFLTEKSPADSPFKKEKQSDLIHGIEDASFRYKLNPIYILAHAILESGWGRSKIAKEKNNLFGYKAYDADPYGNAMSFRSYLHCIDVVMKHVHGNYLIPGGKYYNGPTLKGMNKKYATDPAWATKIRKIMNDIYLFTSERKK